MRDASRGSDPLSLRVKAGVAGKHIECKVLTTAADPNASPAKVVHVEMARALHEVEVQFEAARCRATSKTNSPQSEAISRVRLSPV